MFAYLYVIAIILITSPCLVSSFDGYLVETLVVVDKLAQDHWTKQTGKVSNTGLKTEILATMSDVSKVYENLNKDYGLNIRFKVTDYVELNANPTLPSVDGDIDANRATDNFLIYLTLRMNKKYDMAVLFTGSNLYFQGIDVRGQANLGDICTKKSLAVVEFSGQPGEDLIAAHEIAHVLGADHEGVNSGRSCSTKKKFIMTASDLMGKNRYTFSSCAYEHMKLTLEGTSCLKNGDPSTIHSGPKIGSLVKADDECKRALSDSHAFVYRKEYAGSYGDNVCLKLACLTKGKRDGKWHVKYVPTSDGLYCGKGKQCDKGKCVRTPTGNDATPDSCPFGDQPVLEGKIKSCSLVTKDQCKDYKDSCCHTCDSANPELGKTADDECRRLEGPDSRMYRHKYGPDDYSTKMCSQLHCVSGMEGRKFKTNVYKAPDGMACGQNKRCVDGKCVVTKDGNPNIQDSCPFGDQPWLTGSIQKSCDDIIWRTGCKNWGKMCCGYCTQKLPDGGFPIFG